MGPSGDRELPASQRAIDQAACRGCSAAGRQTVKRVPTPTALSTCTVPPSASTQLGGGHLGIAHRTETEARPVGIDDERSRPVDRQIVARGVVDPPEQRRGFEGGAQGAGDGVERRRRARLHLEIPAVLVEHARQRSEVVVLLGQMPAVEERLLGHQDEQKGRTEEGGVEEVHRVERLLGDEEQPMRRHRGGRGGEADRHRDQAGRHDHEEEHRAQGQGPAAARGHREADRDGRQVDGRLHGEERP